MATFSMLPQLEPTELFHEKTTPLTFNSNFINSSYCRLQSLINNLEADESLHVIDITDTEVVACGRNSEIVLE